MQKPAASSPLVGVALVIGSCLSLPFGAAVAAQLFPVLGPWGVTSLRVAIAAILLVVIVRPKPRKWTRPQWLAAVLFGVSLAAMNGFFYAAIDRIPLGPAVAIEFLGPLVLAAVLTRRLGDFAWVGVALLGMVVLGIDGLIGAEPLDPLGVVFILIAAGFWVMYIRMSARVGALIPGSSGLAMGLLVAAVLLIPVGIPAASTVAMDPQLLLLAAITAVLSSVIPYSFELAALRRLPQRVFGVLLSLEPAFATLAGWLILGQDATPLRLLAIALVIAASVGTTLGVRRDRRDGGHSGPFTAPIPLPD
ncbi:MULTISPECIES: DMT family transporter [unclassified Microbacterium]|uniref:EamA family transporter n=1 Tax=unclassified Microbacterium TaxID=2609290 RepID=UPI000CFBB19B|nr:MULTISPECIES: DMT family transporter [unclassified Microbacterium]PQZ59242.1 EamA family transporter [Microbacterium sp. MYb43]PQZ81335.1 EamA family transporter [Microbacterium sp. MYb40]PRB21901.1 EamA family transporter [Microbacterium sp. MYb54]PRB31670.1 EamA family transporter [Microbacterium sp. MYb50]PRB68502.1 EamA family transporter [Microbacterium sp. MYb24]